MDQKVATETKSSPETAPAPQKVNSDLVDDKVTEVDTTAGTIGTEKADKCKEVDLLRPDEEQKPVEEALPQETEK